MSLLENNSIQLRALEASDLDLLFSVENDPQYWEVSNTLTPFSKELLSRYLKNAHQDIYEAKQLRLAVSSQKDQQVVGLVDLFDFNPQHSRAGIGILILQQYQQKGYAKNALKVFLSYCFKHLDIHQLYANIPVSNKSSLNLFNELNFVEVGIQKDWIKTKGTFEDVILLQIINPDHI